MKTPGLHHITLVTGDAPRTVLFYRDVLGLGLVKRTINLDEPNAYHLYFGDEIGRPGTLVTFFEWRGIPPGYPAIGGVHHLALEVRDAEALLKWKRWLNDHAVPTTGPVDRGYFLSLYFRDPDGQILELATAGPGYAIDEPKDRLGEQIVIPPGALLKGSPESEALLQRRHPEEVPALTRDMAIGGIHHISGISDDLDAAHGFYEGALGLTRIKRTMNQDDPAMSHHFWARYDGATVERASCITLFEWSRRRGSGTPLGPGQAHHVAFRARDADEQLAWRDLLEVRGIPVSPVMDRHYYTSIYFHAPDGLLVEIATEGPGMLVDERREELGSRLVLPAWLEGEREQIERSLVPLP